MKKRLYVPLLLTASLALSGCGTKEEAQEKKEATEHTHAHGVTSDITEITKNADTLPSFLSSQSEQVQQIYHIAAQNHELLSWIPCYCGCGDSVGHKSNKNCFIREIRETGEIVWDSHATTCVNCLEIALESASLKQKGKSTIEIRNYIDTKYKEGFAKPTPTPMPQ